MTVMIVHRRVSRILAGRRLPRLAAAAVSDWSNTTAATSRGGDLQPSNLRRGSATLSRPMVAAKGDIFGKKLLSKSMIRRFFEQCQAQIGGLPLAIARLTGRRHAAFVSEPFLRKSIALRICASRCVRGHHSKRELDRPAGACRRRDLMLKR